MIGFSCICSILAFSVNLNFWRLLQFTCQQRFISSSSLFSFTLWFRSSLFWRSDFILLASSRTFKRNKHSSLSYLSFSFLMKGEHWECLHSRCSVRVRPLYDQLFLGNYCNDESVVLKGEIRLTLNLMNTGLVNSEQQQKASGGYCPLIGPKQSQTLAGHLFLTEHNNHTTWQSYRDALCCPYI